FWCKAHRAPHREECQPHVHTSAVQADAADKFMKQGIGCRCRRRCVLISWCHSQSMCAWCRCANALLVRLCGGCDDSTRQEQWCDESRCETTQKACRRGGR